MKPPNRVESVTGENGGQDGSVRSRRPGPGTSVGVVKDAATRLQDDFFTRLDFIISTRYSVAISICSAEIMFFYRQTPSVTERESTAIPLSRARVLDKSLRTPLGVHPRVNDQSPRSISVDIACGVTTAAAAAMSPFTPWRRPATPPRRTNETAGLTLKLINKHGNTVTGRVRA